MDFLSEQFVVSETPTFRSKRKRLKAKGWRLTSAEEFLGLTREEAALVEMKLALADAVKAQRQALGSSKFPPGYREDGERQLQRYEQAYSAQKPKSP